ncbi:intelectin-1-like [Orbicella faveolata]|uniref:intelectin-1-like n=1 Tax=Orbicella faveolata TaxID=48498 RepID=UPI0009E647B0|nr:intelectin-1-like [Orbicella faveolata]
MCTAHTGYGILKAVGRLRIKEPPVITKRPSSQVAADEGSTLRFCCEASGSPPPKVQWSRAQHSSDSTLAFQQKGCLEINRVKYNSNGDYICQARNRFGLAETTTTLIVNTKVNSCEEVITKYSAKTSGRYELTTTSIRYIVYCDITVDGKGWTLTARFSNNDEKNWMRDDGFWWYDHQLPTGTTTDPSINSDMISPAFWLVGGKEFKITRSDDPSHTPLLQTTGNCLAGQTFRSKIISYGDFREGKVWASDQCLGSCTVQYGSQYKSTDGFQQAECSGNIQSANNIGFWCDWTSGDGSVMMIGGGGSSCWRADHGIGITEKNSASFVEGDGQTEYDFGYDAETGNPPSQSYSLNLWIR